MKKILILLMLVITGNNVFACECSNFPSLAEKFETAKYVALMEALKPEEFVLEGWPHKRFKFVTLETFKGEPLPYYEVIESEPRTSCNIDVIPNSKYLVFHMEGNEISLWTCSPSQPLEFIKEEYPNWRNELSVTSDSKKILQLKAADQKRIN